MTGAIWLVGVAVFAATLACLLLVRLMNARTKSLRFSPSRAVMLRVIVFTMIAVYLGGMLWTARELAAAGGAGGIAVQALFVLAAAILALRWFPSARLYGWVRVTLLKHLFAHRYDYRAEWLRFTETIGRPDRQQAELAVRAVQALADIAGSERGALFLPAAQHGGLEMAAQWQWAGLATVAEPLVEPLVAALEPGGYIVDLDDIRAGRSAPLAPEMAPAWLLAENEAWVLVPLLHFDRLAGIVLLARPAAPRRLDWEDLDLFRIAGRQLASYLAEQSAQQALAEAARFDEFHRRIAFVMHDIKNLASQLALLARNAERHAENPAFRADMMVTLRNSADKLNALLARLGRYGRPGAAAPAAPLDLAALARKVASGFLPPHRVFVAGEESCPVLGHEEALEQALTHLVQNALDASSEGVPVVVQTVRERLSARLEIVDSGTGMTPQFLRHSLFSPFISSKPGGFGIGAFEARELIRAMGGQLEVESREGLGTRFILTLPLAGTQAIASAPEQKDVA